MIRNRLITSALLSLLLVTTLLGLPPAVMAESLAEHRIKISFDLGEHKIFGTVDATFPESVKGIGVGKGLKITKFVINGKSAAPKVDDNRIDLPPHRGKIQVQMEYEGVFSHKQGENLANIIGDEGAFLLSDWYPAGEAELARFSLQALIPKNFKAVSEAHNV